jgi:superfamily I DNA/RNA helicase
VGLILAFEHHFPGAAVIRLEENYRSTETILAAANGIVSRIPSRRAKRLWTRGGVGEPLGWIEAEDPQGEAEEVAAAILAEVYRSQRPWSHFAVLYRTNSQARPFEAAFRSHGVPHAVLGGGRFLDRKEVRDLLCYLRVLHNPRDEASLLRIANVPRRGLGPQTLLALKDRAAGRAASLRAVLGDAEGLAPQARAGARALTALLTAYEERFRRDGLTADGLEDFIRDVGLRAEIENAYDSALVRRRRLQLLEEVVDLVPSGPTRAGKVDLGLFVERLSLDPPGSDPGEDEAAVRLLTLHSAKGLEFPVVFLTGLEEGLLPHARDVRVGSDSLEEERRLCYVGMTRARELLWLSRAKTRRRRGTPATAVPSRFLSEIPLELTLGRGQESGRTDEREEEVARDFFAGVREMLR